MSSSVVLSEKHIEVVKSTIPLLESVGAEITEYFYQRMFKGHPELQHIFNMSNQRSGKQQLALFNAIAAYAKHIDNLPALTEAVERIANKHTSLNIRPEHYPIVGENLIGTLRELAGDVFTKEVEEAWTAAYGFLANIFIGKEESLYAGSAASTGGWRDARKFRLIEKRIESELVKSLVFEPVDKGPVIDYRPGQYIGIQLTIPGKEYREIRQYSLSDKPNGETYQISVKREITGTPGVVSNYLHDGLRLGDEVDLYAPAGDFYYQDGGQKPRSSAVLISAGVGLTPMQSMVEYLAVQQGVDAVQTPVYFLHACENVEQHSFKKRIRQLAESMPLVHHTWYRSDHDDDPTIHHGYMDLAQIEQDLPIADGDFYLCGPVAFMQFAKQQLQTLGVNVERIHYEVFGPHEMF